MIWVGKTGKCIWSYNTGIINDDEWFAFCKYIEDMSNKYNTGAILYLTIAERVARTPTSLQRKALADVLSGEFNRPDVSHAFVTDSLLNRGVLTVMGWLYRKQYSEKIFENREDALIWGKSKIPTLDILDILDDMKVLRVEDAISSS